MNHRDRDFRPNRRRSFDDDNYEPPRRNFGFAPPSGPQFETPSGPSVRATVKWYNPEKGFGFVQLADGSGDAFLHARVAERSGHASVPPGATLEVRTSPGPKGPQGYCQLKRPWYARRVGGAAARVGELLCSPIMLPRSAERGRRKAPWVR